MPGMFVLSSILSIAAVLIATDCDRIFSFPEGGWGKCVRTALTVSVGAIAVLSFALGFAVVQY